MVRVVVAYIVYHYCLRFDRLLIHVVVGFIVYHYCLKFYRGIVRVVVVILSDEKLFVFKYCFIFIALGLDTSTLCRREGKRRCDQGSTGGRDLTVCCGQYGK